MKLEVKDLSFAYPASKSNSIDSVSLIAASGSWWCIAGPNGSGKSTLLKLMSGILSDPVTRKISWDGTSVCDFNKLELARSIAFVPGSLHSSFDVSVFDFVAQGRFAYSSLWSGLSAIDRRKTRDAIERVGITHIENSLITEISVGECQLALLARAIVQEPKVIMLDETTSNLDLKFQLKIFNLLRDLNNLGISIFVVTHDLNLAVEFCPNYLWMKNGKVLKSGTRADTFSSETLQQVYELGDKAIVSKNPFTQNPKLYFKP